MSTAAPAKARTYPVVEIFGPTVQGEGPAVGTRCWFLRLGGCEYRCSWCDSMFAVEPEQVRKAPRMSAATIDDQLRGYGCAEGGMVVLSGGNPALHHADPLMDALRDRVVHVETQGTVYRPWLDRCALVVVSPKPPSSGMAEGGVRRAQAFVAKLSAPWVLKFVAFDEVDLDWAVEARAAIDPQQQQEAFLSAGTDQVASSLADAVVTSYRWLANQHVSRPELAPFRIGLQAHVLAWPGELGR